MASLGRIHPLVIHFPIALVLIAALAELIATITGRLYWRTVAVANVRVGAAFGVIAATAGWFLPRVLGLDSAHAPVAGTLGDRRDTVAIWKPIPWPRSIES